MSQDYGENLIVGGVQEREVHVTIVPLHSFNLFYLKTEYGKQTQLFCRFKSLFKSVWNADYDCSNGWRTRPLILMFLSSH